MEGYVETMKGNKRPAASPMKTVTPKKVPFVGISPLKEFNFKIPRERTFKVSVEGNIGAGKSTLIKYFEGMPGIETYAVSRECFVFDWNGGKSSVSNARLKFKPDLQPNILLVAATSN